MTPAPMIDEQKRRLTAAQIEQLRNEGWLLVDDVLDPATDIAPVIEEYAERLDHLAASLVAEGKLSSTYEELPYTARLTRICAETGQTFGQYFDISLPQKGVRPDTPINVGPAVFRLLSNPRLLDVVQDIIGPEIYSNPVQHTRMKLPTWSFKKDTGGGLVEKIPWHQDNGVILPEADDADILTVWMPITEATLQNGCLQVIPRSHLHGLETHCPSNMGPQIPSRLLPLEQARPVPMKPGSVLLMTQRTIHASLENVSDEVRWSFDLRYQVIGRPTGRPAFPGFIARSAAHPESVLRDPVAWAQTWYAARATLAAQEDPTYNRWDGQAEACA